MEKQSYNIYVYHKQHRHKVTTIREMQAIGNMKFNLFSEGYYTRTNKRNKHSKSVTNTTIRA